MKAPTTTDYREAARELYRTHGEEPGALLAMLSTLQERFRHVPVDALLELAEVGSWTFADLAGFVSCFDDLSLEPVGRHLVLVCDGTACHAVGSTDLVKALEDRLHVACGETSADGEWTLRKVHCVGACSLAPVVVVDGLSHGRVKLSRIDDLLPQAGDEDDGDAAEADGPADRADAPAEHAAAEAGERR